MRSRCVLCAAYDAATWSSLARRYAVLASRRIGCEGSRIDRTIRGIRFGRVLARSGAKCAIDSALAARSLAPPTQCESRLCCTLSAVGWEGCRAATWRKLYPPIVEIESHELKLASRAWRAYCAPTPQSWCDLFKTNLAWLPQLSPYATALLEELPRPASGLGATEARILRLIARGGVQPFDVFPGHQKSYELHVCGYWEVGALLDGLARCDEAGGIGTG